MDCASRSAARSRAEAYRALTPVADDALAAGSLRFVALDTETTGLDPRRDRIITIGAVDVVNGEIDLAASFEVMLKIAYNASSVTVHGITREEAEAGMEEDEAMGLFLEYLGCGVIAGHHIGHDIEALNAACERHFGFEMHNRSLDTMDLALHLERDGVFGDEQFHDFSLDTLCRRFGIRPHDRHTAPGDAFLTALILQRLLRLGARAGRTTLGALAERWEVSR